MEYSLSNIILIIVNDEEDPRGTAYDWFTIHSVVPKENVREIGSNWIENISKVILSVKDSGLIPVFYLDQELNDKLNGTDLCKYILEQQEGSIVLPGSRTPKDQIEKWRRDIPERLIMSSSSTIAWTCEELEDESIRGILEYSLKNLEERRENQEGGEYRNR